MSHEGALSIPSAWKATGDVYRDLMGDIGPVETIVDIGIDFGYSMFKLALDFPRALVVGVDNFSYPTHVNSWKHMNVWLPHFDNVIIFAGESHSYGRKWPLISSSHIDILSIDGDHSYPGVKGDFDAWIPYVRKGGVVLFHDVQHYPNECGVPRLFSELPDPKVEHKAGGPGVGIWWKQ